MLKAISDYFNDFRLNFCIEYITFLAHRITGIALTLYLFLHIWTLSSAKGGAGSFNQKVSAYDNFVGHMLEYFLLFVVLIHTINGLRIIIGDFFFVTKKHKALLIYGIILILIIMMASFWYFF